MERKNLGNQKDTFGGETDEDKEKVEGRGETGNNKGSEGRQFAGRNIQEVLHRPLHADEMEGVVRNIRS